MELETTQAVAVVCGSVHQRCVQRGQEDTDRDEPEPEQCIWTVVKPQDWNQQVHLGWRYSAASLQRLAREGSASRTPEKRQGCAE